MASNVIKFNSNMNASEYGGGVFLPNKTWDTDGYIDGCAIHYIAVGDYFEITTDGLHHTCVELASVAGSQVTVNSVSGVLITNIHTSYPFSLSGTGEITLVNGEQIHSGSLDYVRGRSGVS